MKAGAALSLSTILCLLLPSARAALRTWDGGGADNYWSTAANWAGDVGPVAGDDLLFPSGAARLSNSNNFPSGTIFNSITLSGGGYTLRGQTIALRSGITNLTGVNLIYTPFLLASNQTFAADSYLQFLSGIELNGNTLTLTGVGELQFTAPLTGAGAIIKTGPSGAGFYGNSSYVGSTEVLQGSLTLGHSNALGLATSGTTVAPGALILLSGPFTVAEPLVLGGRLASTAGTNVWSGPITLISNTATIEAGAPLLISGLISGTGSLTKVGSSTLRLAANNTYTGKTTNTLGALNSALIINGSQPLSDVYQILGTFGGTGTVGSVTSSSFDNIVSPGESGVGKLTTSNLTLNSGTLLLVRLDNSTPGSGYGQVNVNGSVTLNNASLGINPRFVPAVGASFLVLNNDGVDPVAGSFRFLPEGAVVNANGIPFRISYAGGSGNDVVVTRISVPARFESITPLTNGQLRLQATGGLPGFTYCIEAATDLHPVIQWSNIGWAVPDPAGGFSFMDTNAPLFPRRFYRALSP